MIYSKDIEPYCRLCKYADNIENEEMIFCRKKKKNFPKTREGCKKFSYDILKKDVRRKQKFNTQFKPEDFTL